MNSSDDLQNDDINDLLEDLQSHTDSESELLSTIAVVLSTLVPVVYLSYKAFKKFKIKSKCCGGEVDIQVGSPSTPKPAEVYYTARATEDVGASKALATASEEDATEKTEEDQPKKGVLRKPQNINA